MRKEDAAAKWLREHAAAGLRRQQARQRGRALEWARKRARPSFSAPLSEGDRHAVPIH